MKRRTLKRKLKAQAGSLDWLAAQYDSLLAAYDSAARQAQERVEELEAERRALTQERDGLRLSVQSQAARQAAEIERLNRECDAADELTAFVCGERGALAADKARQASTIERLGRELEAAETRAAEAHAERHKAMEVLDCIRSVCGADSITDIPPAIQSVNAESVATRAENLRLREEVAKLQAALSRPHGVTGEEQPCAREWVEPRYLLPREEAATDAGHQ